MTRLSLAGDHHDNFRRAADRRDWTAVAKAAEEDAAERGAGLFEVDGDDPGRRLVTNVRKIAGRRRRRQKRAKGSVLIGAGGWLLAGLGAGLFAVSFAGQYKYIFTARGGHGVDVLSAIEAGMLDLGMIIFTVLALGLARAGQPARTERALILACAFGSAGMNYAAAVVTSPRSVVAFVAPPVFLAVVVDRVVSVIRRHVLGEEETSPWAPAGRLVRLLARAAGLVTLYLLRFILAPPSTGKGLRRVVLSAAPLPDPAVRLVTVEKTGGELPPPPDKDTKKARLLAAYRLHAEYGNRDVASRVASELAEDAGLQAGSARSYIYAELADLAGRAKQNGST
jgi:hypothetical protein